MTLCKSLGGFICFGALLLSPADASATFHLWQIDQVYSNASGTVQFVEMFTNASGQDHFTSGGAETFASNTHTLTFDHNPPFSTANHHLLLATPSYIALSGVPPADYNLGVDHFFSPTGDTLDFAFGTNTLTFTNGQLPLNGTSALFRAFGSSTFTTGPNHPTNFAGQTGSVPEPSTFLLGALALTFLSLCAWRQRKAIGSR